MRGGGRWGRQALLSGCSPSLGPQLVPSGAGAKSPDTGHVPAPGTTGCGITGTQPPASCLVPFLLPVGRPLAA